MDLLAKDFKKYKNCRCAFTLAEVLITLAIIGVVAAMTIPTLMNNVQDSQYKTAYKKAYTVLSQALISASNNGDTVGTSTDSDSTNFLAIMKNFKIVKQCTNNNVFDCWEQSGELFGKDYSSGAPYLYDPAFIDNSGFAWVNISSHEGRIAVDTNGFKKPNQYGKDRFVFTINDKSDMSVITNNIPMVVGPWADNQGNICFGNVCGTKNNYYGTSWLYGAN